MQIRKVAYSLATVSLSCTCVILLSSLCPYWIHSDILEVDQGLFMRCVGLKCMGFWTDDFHWGRLLPWWQVLAMLAFSLALVLVYLTERMQMMFGVRVCKVSAIMLLVASAMMVLCMTVYGTMARRYWHTQLVSDPKALSYFSWGYWSGVSSAFMCLFTAILYLCAHCAPTPGGWIKPDIGYG